MDNGIIVSIYKRTLMNGMSPGQIPVHILMSLANKCSCNLLILLRRSRNLPSFHGVIRRRGENARLVQNTKEAIRTARELARILDIASYSQSR